MLCTKSILLGQFLSCKALFCKESIVESQPDISVVIPAFNESKRLPTFLNELVEHCKNSQRSYEIIVVDDGSSDQTAKSALEFQGIFPSLSVYRLETNRGKGYAVKYGLFRSSGSICLFTDADGSTPPTEIERNLSYLDEGYDIFIGSRVLKDEGRRLETKFHRKAIGTVFNFFVKNILSTKIKDTQCGFKIFKKEIIHPLFSRMNLTGFGFDLEILYLAHKMGYKVKEGPVSWRHVKGSKVNLFADSIKMFINIVQVRNWHCTPINPESLYLGRDEYRFMFEMENYHWWFISRNKFVMHLIESMDRSLPNILDAGSGTGVNLSSFSKFGNAFGIDISPQAIQFCRKRNLKTLVRGSLEQIGFKGNTFDLITCLDVLEHIVDPPRILGELKRTLKDDGKMIISVPAFRFLWSRHDEALSHLRRYTKEDLRLELQDAGFRIEKMGYFFFVSFFIVAPIRIIRKFLSAESRSKSDTTTLPPRLLNEFLKILLSLEMKITDYFSLPLGTTLYAVVSKNGNQ
jgi:dolichyl-phosphate beta-glucosyltransferase